MGVFTETVVPILGNFTAAFMLLSPFPAVLRIRNSGKLGDINPLPYPMTVINAAGWVAYGFAIANPYVFPANIIGFLGGLFFTLTAFTISSRKMQDRITGLLVVGSAYIMMLGLIACFGLSDKASARLWGTSAVVILMLYYLVPLSTMVAILRERNAASIYPPLAATAIANGTLWAVYGLAVQDINLWLPNLFGAVIGVLQLALRLVYGARPTASDAAPAPAGRTLADEEMAFAKAQIGTTHPPPEVGERINSADNLLPNGGHGALANGSSAPAASDGAAGAAAANTAFRM